MARKHDYNPDFLDSTESTANFSDEQGYIDLIDFAHRSDGFGFSNNYSILLDKNNDRTIPDHILRIEQNSLRVKPLISLYVSFSNTQDPTIFKAMLREKIKEYENKAYGGGVKNMQSQKALEESSEALVVLTKTLLPLSKQIRFVNSPQIIKQALEEAINFHLENIEHIIKIRKNSKLSCIVAKKEGGGARRVTSKGVAKDAKKVLCSHIRTYLPANKTLNNTPTISQEILSIYCQYIEEMAKKHNASASKRTVLQSTGRQSVNLAVPIQDKADEFTTEQPEEFE